MGSCDTILVGIESDEPQFDPIMAAVGGVLGCLVGVILGIFLSKFCCLQFIKRHFRTSSTINHNEEAQFVSYKENVAYENKQTSLTFVSRKKSSSISTINSETSDKDTFNKFQSQGNYRNSFVETALMPSLENIVDHQIHIALRSFNHLFVSCWKDRRTCILQIFKLILNDYLDSNTITKSDQEKILQDVEMALANITGEECKRKSSRTNAEKNFLYDDKLNYVVSLCRNVVENFERKLLELVGFRDAAVIHDVLVKCFKNIEKSVRQNQDFQIQVLTDSFRRDLLVLQAYHSGNTAMHELMRKRRHYYEVMLDRLVEADRINENESETLWLRVKEEVETTFDDIMGELQISAEKLKLSFDQERKQTECTLSMRRNKSVERYIDDGYPVSPFQRIQNYFSMISTLQQQESQAMEEITKSEIAGINELQKKAKNNLQRAFGKMQEDFCESLFTNELLSEKEAQVFMNELIKKNERASDDVATINHIQTRIIDREAKQMRCVATRDSDEDQDISDAVKQLLLSRDERLAKTFIESQSYLPEEEYDAIMYEYHVFTMMLDNHQHLARCLAWFSLDVELLRMQIRTLLLERQEEGFTSDEDVDNLVRRLEKQRRSYEADKDDVYSSSEKSPWSHLKRDFLCDLVADSAINILHPEMKKVKKKETNLKRIKNGFITKTLHLDISNRQLEQIFSLHRDKVEETEVVLRQQHELELQILRERLNAQNRRKMEKLRGNIDDRPLSASSLSASDLLQRLFDQDRNKREIEVLETDLEAHTMTQIHLLVIDFQDKLQSNLQNLDQAILCKLAKAFGMRRNNFIQCLADILTDASVSDRKKTIADVMRYWEKTTTAGVGYQQRLDISNDDNERRRQTRQKSAKKSKLLSKKTSLF